MRTQKINETGNKYGFLIVLKEAPRMQDNRISWLCRCECGNKINLIGKNLRNGKTISCGCKFIHPSITHGLKNHPLYSIWSNIKQRCLNKNHPRYKDYGKRGIRIHTKWINDFKVFYEWAINNGWTKGKEIHRKNNNGNYSQRNCVWISKEEHSKIETRHHKRIKINGKHRYVKEWCKIFGINNSTVQRRMNKYNWSPKKAIITPKMK